MKIQEVKKPTETDKRSHRIRIKQTPKKENPDSKFFDLLMAEIKIG